MLVGDYMDIIDCILEKKAGELITENEIKIILQGFSDYQRYGIVKRAMASGRLIRIRRGLYCLNEKYRKKPLNLFEVAEKIYGPSYISFLSALFYYGWIPEAVYTITSACVKRSKTFKTPVGMFSYLKIPVKDAFFDVNRKSESNGSFFIASPVKALLDFIFVYKKEWDSIDPLFRDLRIERNVISKISFKQLEILALKYKNRRIDNFVQGIKMELKNEH